MLNSGCFENQDKERDCATHSFILVVTSLLLILNILFFLETTFYPFALFTTGLVTIVKVLLPFLTVSALVLIGFVATYRIRSNFNPDYDGHEACERDFSECLLFVTNNFFGGPDETSGWLDVFFGIMVVVILLNVVIAIVSDAWEDAKELTSTTFWQSRVNFLAESGFDYQPKNSFFEWIDGLHVVPINDSTPWHKDEPYKSVRCKDHHDNPRHYFILEDAVKIEEARSLESILFWVRVESIAAGEHAAVTNAKLIGPTIVWFSGNLMYSIFVILGFPTLGILCPRDWRIFIMSGFAVEESHVGTEGGLPMLHRQNVKNLKDDSEKEDVPERRTCLNGIRRARDCVRRKVNPRDNISSDGQFGQWLLSL